MKYDKVISHRGNLQGRVPEKENSVEYIDLAISQGYDVEVDVRVKDGLLYLGHDAPQYLVDLDWLKANASRLWIHCKDIDAYKIVSEVGNLQYFCHTSDDFCLTSTLHLWVHDLSANLNEMCIIPLLDLNAIQSSIIDKRVHAICTDYVTMF